MQIEATQIPEVLRITPARYADERGWFLEAWSSRNYSELGFASTAQANVSRSTRGVLRGLHLQFPESQAKLVEVLVGTVLDVAVDLRRDSPTFGRWVAERLSQDNHRQLLIPRGFAHGFCVESAEAIVVYHCDAPYRPEQELGLHWADPELSIPWPTMTPNVSRKDAQWPTLREIDRARLVKYREQAFGPSEGKSLAHCPADGAENSIAATD